MEGIDDARHARGISIVFGSHEHDDHEVGLQTREWVVNDGIASDRKVCWITHMIEREPVEAVLHLSPKRCIACTISLYSFGKTC